MDFEVAMATVMTCDGPEFSLVDVAICRAPTKPAGGPGALTVRQYALIATELQNAHAQDRTTR